MNEEKWIPPPEQIERAIDTMRKNIVPGLSVSHIADYVDELRGKYNELILAVENKYEWGSRHETALRYIKAKGQPINVDLLEAAQDALNHSVDCRAYPDGPCLNKDIRDTLRQAIKRAQGSGAETVAGQAGSLSPNN